MRTATAGSKRLATARLIGPDVTSLWPRVLGPRDMETRPRSRPLLVDRVEFEGGFRRPSQSVGGRGPDDARDLREVAPSSEEPLDPDGVLRAEERGLIEVDDATLTRKEYPLCVDEAMRQMWLDSRFFTRTTTWFYDADSGELIANEFDRPDGPPPGSIPVERPALQTTCSPLFESNPANLKARVNFGFHYDQLLDAIGSPGTILTVQPFHITDEDSFWVYYNSAILPDEEAQTWDDTLADIEAGVGGFAISKSLKPDPRPPSLLTHDPPMTGWSQAFAPGRLTPLPRETFEDPDCGTEQVFLPFPGGELPV